MINFCVVSGDVLDKPRFIFSKSEHPMTFFNLGLWLEGKRIGYITVGCLNGSAILAAKHLRPGSWVVASGWLLREMWIDLEGISGKYVTLKAEELEFIAADGPGGWRRPPRNLKKRSKPTDKAHPTDMNKANWASQRLVLPKSKVQINRTGNEPLQDQPGPQMTWRGPAQLPPPLFNWHPRMN